MPASFPYYSLASPDNPVGAGTNGGGANPRPKPTITFTPLLVSANCKCILFSSSPAASCG